MHPHPNGLNSRFPKIPVLPKIPVFLSGKIPVFIFPTKKTGILPVFLKRVFWETGILGTGILGNRVFWVERVKYPFLITGIIDV
jgi:hypothetical protein